ncbi:hypothetical protein Acr_01g0000210 [Actinidia rufa]|uniref:Uncharacterized protein n=1 Tax=Actinidia rufa TaxID=165716 RepID=A0A7J0E1Q0_9ERIC|nr:hypothetical protein Acr_01g0000210 [Actinidia rufa]
MKGFDEMGCDMANNTLDLCRCGLQEVGKAEHLDAALAEDEIDRLSKMRTALQDHSRVGGWGGNPSTSAPGLSTR